MQHQGEVNLETQPLKYTKCNLTEDIDVTIYVPEIESFDRERLNDETAAKISKDIASRRIDCDFKIKYYHNIRHDIARDFNEESINMYECRYECIPDDDYDNYITNIFRTGDGEKFHKRRNIFKYFDT